MTRKDFELIAGVLAGNLQAETDSDEAHNDAIKAVALDFATRLASTNERFDKDRFLKAAGVVA